MPGALSITFPHMGDYHAPIARLLRDIFPRAQVIAPPATTAKTVELGAKASPDFICAPFKYNVGNFIEALDAGANVLVQTGTGCRCGYYGEAQQEILRDMGYEFHFLCLARENARLPAAFARCRELNPALTWTRFASAAAAALERICAMDRLDFFLREHVGFERGRGGFERAKAAFLREIAAADGLLAIRRVYGKYREIYENIPLEMPEKPLRVGIIGELYTLMDPFSTDFLEAQLAGYGVAVSRKMSVSYLLFGKRDRAAVRRSGGFLRHTVGATGADSVAQLVAYARRGYDGVLHLKSFGCTPELNAQPALANAARELKIPILHMSFDTQTGEAGVRTRVEAFADMLGMKRGI